MRRKKREMTLEEVARALGHLYLLDPVSQNWTLKHLQQ